MNISIKIIIPIILFIFSNQLPVSGKDKNPTIYTRTSSIVASQSGKVGSAYAFQVNKVRIPLDNKGVIAEVSVSGLTSGEYDDISFLFSAGFLMSGIADTGFYPNNGYKTWANGVASSSRIVDYIPGTVASPNHPDAQIYVVDKLDPPFGASWQDWIYAVALGADFYDGDHDSIYNPVDKNSNGVWDSNEDRPDMLGDITAWCVYNDGAVAPQRFFTSMSPCGIEIQQTIWGYRIPGVYENILFIRYRIFSRGIGNYSGEMDSVYFGAWTDADIGDYTDDLVGCDTLLNGGYIFNDGDDNTYGYDPPCFLIDLLQGPIVYVPGITFQDNNSNGVYDKGVDTPLDTAMNNRGATGGIVFYPGAKNEEVSSMVHYFQSNPVRGDPSFASEARYYLLGRLRSGQLLNPCGDTYGAVFVSPCSTINPLYWYSGDPVSHNGWIQTSPGDMKSMQNVGPFQLKPNQPVDIIVGYVVGRGTSSTNSVTVAKNYTGTMITNFNPLVSVNDRNQQPLIFVLNQNYPNPFNPSTKINYQLPDAGSRFIVKLKIYDLLGREIATLVNLAQDAGHHSVEWNAQAATGVYFYRLEATSVKDPSKRFVETRKMLLLR